MATDSRLADEVMTAAARWLQRCDAGLSAPERAEFLAWVKADPSHGRALAQANPQRTAVDLIAERGLAETILDGLEKKLRRQRRRRKILGTAASCVMLLAAALLWRFNARPSADAAPQHSPLVVVSPETLRLPDGSVVELKDGARVDAHYSEKLRDVSLVRGTAYFHVAKDPGRPFVVTAGGLAVQAVGTAFTVALAERDLTVLVTEGQVRVDASATSAGQGAIAATQPIVSLAAGNSVVLPVTTSPREAPTVHTADAAEIQAQTGWRIPKLEFPDTPLRDVVAQMNAYNARKFELADSKVGDLRVAGVLRADKMDDLIEMLASDFGVQADREGETVVLRRTTK